MFRLATATRPARALPRLAQPMLRSRAMHDDFKPKVRTYAADSEESSVHAQAPKSGLAHLCQSPVREVPCRCRRSKRTWTRIQS